MTNAQKQSRTGVLAIVLAYAFLGGLWILLSDGAMGLLIHDPLALVKASIVKGLLFVAVTTLLLYLLVRRLAGALIATHQLELEYERDRKLPPPMLVAIADASADAIYAKDEEGRYLLLSKAAARIVGKSAQEVVGKDDRAIFPAGQAQHLMDADRRIRQTGMTEVREEMLNTADGERIFLTIKGPLRNPDGRIFGSYGISHDITERKHAEALLHESQVRLRLLVDHAPVSLAIFDLNMRYLEASQRWREDYLAGQGNITGRSHYEVSPEAPEKWKAIHQRGMAGETISAEEDRLERQDGSVLWLRWEVRPWLRRDGAIGGIVIFSEDVSLRKTAELALRQRNQELEHFNRVATERELRMIALKREVNEMAGAAGRPAPYDTSFADATGVQSGQ
jgi:PAS domain S-box-containing protein